MLSGWYCRGIANQQNTQQDEPTDPNVEDDSGSDEDSHDQAENRDNAAGANAVDYKTQYRYLKRKLKFLIYENEFFQDALRSNQRRLLKVSRDRAFLLDRLLQYEKPENTSSESDETDSSEDEATKEAKKRKLEQTANGAPRGRKKKVQPVPSAENADNAEKTTAEKTQPTLAVEVALQQSSALSSADLDRHLQSRPPVMDVVPERAPATVPTEMFSNEPSLDSESNDHMMDGSSPTHVAAEECVPMEYSG